MRTRRSSTRGVAVRLLREAVDLGRPVQLSPRGRCMAPLIRAGDRIEIGKGSPVVGDVALTSSDGGELHCHRVLAVRQGVVTMAGDRSSRVFHHPSSEVIGIVRKVARGSSTLVLDRGWVRVLGRIEAAMHRMRSSPRSSVARRLLVLLHRLAAAGQRLAWRTRGLATSSSR